MYLVGSNSQDNKPPSSWKLYELNFLGFHNDQEIINELNGTRTFMVYHIACLAKKCNIRIITG